MDKQELQTEAVKRLKTIIKPKDTIYGIVVNVARSGLSRHIRFFCVNEGQIVDISYNLAVAMNRTYDSKRHAVKVKGAGTDMVFQTVYELGYRLYENPFAFASYPL